MEKENMIIKKRIVEKPKIQYYGICIKCNKEITGTSQDHYLFNIKAHMKSISCKDKEEQSK